jgi:hypothetical protein
MKLIKIIPSAKAEKKYDAVFQTDKGRTKTVSFGAKGMSDFTIHKDETRKQNYLARHAPREDWTKPDSAGALSRFILWNKPTFTASLADYRSRFNL